MTTPPTAYPLQWPTGWPATDVRAREIGKFKQTVPTALNNLKRQVELLGGHNLVLSSNYTLGIENPKESGVVAYFNYENAPVAIPCDRWSRIEQNVQAIALTIEAMRGMERWGAKHMIKAMFTGFKALPQNSGGTSWWQTLGVDQNATADQIKTAYRKLAMERHPDRCGGNHEPMVLLNQAYEMALNQNGRNG